MSSNKYLFIQEAKKLGVDITEVDTPMGIQFKYGSTRDMFKLWNISNSREGYIQIPVSVVEDLSYAIDCAEIESAIDEKRCEELKSILGVVE